MTAETRLVRLGRRITALGDVRKDEYSFSWSVLRGCEKILDVACGTGTFMRIAPERIVGVDINPENVEYCRRLGLDAKLGDALGLPYPDASFDGVHSSHVMQVFAPEQAVRYIHELTRVVRPGGKIVITTLNDFRRFFRHPENVRPYPPDSLFRLLHKQSGAQSPMFPGAPKLLYEKIWRRHPPLVEFEFPSVYGLQPYCGVLNSLQYLSGLRKWWRFNAYSIHFSVAQSTD